MARTIQTGSKSTGNLDNEIRENECDEDLEEDEPISVFILANFIFQARKKGKGPPAKRAKKGSGAARAKQSLRRSSRRKKSLSLLPAMPLDILFEVFSHLAPKDIIHLSRTSRIFRDTLMMRSATSVWKAARERCEAPECPSTMSEPQWAVLLFGNLCQNCGAKNVPKPDFAILRRVCIYCKKNKYLVEARFKTKYEHVDPEVLELILYTNVGAWSNGYARGGRYFWSPDIDAMLLKLAEYEHNIHLRRPGAHQALQNFKSQQIEMVASIRESVRERGQWCDQFALGRYKDKQAAIDQRFESIQSKFLEMGYTRNDVEFVYSERECQQPALLTDRIWNRIRPILEPMILEKKRERLEREMREMRFARKEIVQTSYQEYQKTLMPSQWKYLPRVVDICEMDPFSAIVNAEADVVVTAADFEDAFRQLPELISAAFDARKLHAHSLLKIPTSANQSTFSAPEAGEIVGEASSSSNSFPLDALDLATAVFKCHEASCIKCLFGWDDIAQHHCKLDFDYHVRNDPWLLNRTKYGPGPPKIEFNALGSGIAAAVVQAVGLDDKVATVSDMDAKTKDIRFGCSLCPPLKKCGNWKKGGYKWRELVSHFTVCLHTPKDALAILPPDVVAMVKESEMTNPFRSSSQWTCGHCTVHLGDTKMREIVVAHLKSVHGIDSPREPEDLFFFTRNPSLVAFEASYPVNGPGNGILKTIRCLECANGKPSEQNRLFDIGGVKSHLAAKHNVKQAVAVAGIHYR